MSDIKRIPMGVCPDDAVCMTKDELAERIAAAVKRVREQEVEPLKNAINEALKWIHRADLRTAQYRASGDEFTDPVQWSRVLQAYDQAETCISLAGAAVQKIQEETK